MAYDIPARLTKLAHQAGIPHCSVLTGYVSDVNGRTQYARSKGQLEATGHELFPRTSVFRAGYLNREEDSGYLEKFICEYL